MSIPEMNSFSITIERSEDGGYRAEFLGNTIAARSLDALMDSIKLALSPSLDQGGSSVETPEQEAEFENDLDRVLTKNAELYRRLAR